MRKVLLATGIVLFVAVGAIISGSFVRLQMATEALAACPCTGPPGAVGDYCCSGGKRKQCRENQTNNCLWEQTNDACSSSDKQC